MKRKINRTLVTAFAVILALSIMCVSVSAVDVKNEKAGLVSYLSDIKNTEFDFDDTSYLDTNICWTVFALEKAGVKNSYPQFESYMNTVVSTNFDTHFPSNFALIYISALESGMDVENIGGKNILNALKNTDYSTQTYLSSLYFPLLALNYNNVEGVESVKQVIINTILATQQSDGGFPYCSVDTGYGITSDTDTTAFVIQALAEYKNNDNVKTALSKAVDYLNTQKFDDGSYGYTAWASKSVESTSQAVIALSAMGTDMSGSIEAVKSFIDPQTGAAKNYMDLPDTMSSYQALLGLIQYDNYLNNADYLYKLHVEPVTTTIVETTTSSLNNVPTTSNTSVDIPKTGGTTRSLIGVSVSAILVGTLIVVSKKNEEK